MPISGDSSEGKQFAIVADARRRWTRQQKQSIVAECEADRASVSAIARKHNIASSLLFRWRREFGLGGHVMPEKPVFVPVALPAPAARSSSAGTGAGRCGLIEIELIGGRRLRVDGSIDVAALRRVIEVLEGR